MIKSFSACPSAVIVVLTALSSTLMAQSNYVDIDTCFVHLIDDIDVPALESGQLISVDVKEGQAVQSGQNLAKMDAQKSQRMLEEAQFRHDVSSRRANDNTEILASQRKVKLATDEFEKNRSLYLKGSKSEYEYQRSQYAKEISELELQSAKNEKQWGAIDAQAELVKVQAAKDSIARHSLTSPIDGHVFEIYHQGGEWVNAGEKVMRVARVDRLRVQGFVEGDQYDPYEVDGRPVTVILTLARGRQLEFQGQIVFVGLEKRGGNRYIVWAEVENRFENNRWILQSGSDVDMRIHLDGRVTSSVGKLPPRLPAAGGNR